MPIMNQAPQQYTEDVAVSYTMTETSGDAADGVVSFGPFWPGPYQGFHLRVDRESETGTCTLDCAIFTYDETTGDITAWLDNAGSAMLLPQWANGSAVVKWMTVYPGATGGGDTDGVLVVDTANRLYATNWVQPIYVKLTTGGTGVTNVVSVSLSYLP
jgi:hypothetical protein